MALLGTSWRVRALGGALAVAAAVCVYAGTAQRAAFAPLGLFLHARGRAAPPPPAPPPAATAPRPGTSPPPPASPPPPRCELVAPERDAAVYWPAVFGAAAAPPAPSAAGGNVSRVWRVELCHRGAGAGWWPPAAPTYLGGSWRAMRALRNASIAVPELVGAAGVVRVTRVGGCAAASRAPPLQAGTPRYLLDAAAELGPDELWLFLEGAELHALRAWHRGACRYEAAFAVTVPGPYRLFVLAARAEWRSLEEGDGQQPFPPVHWDSVLGARALVTLGDARAAEPARRWLFEQAPTRLPRCAAADVSPAGRWVRTVPTSAATFAPPAPPFVPPTGPGQDPRVWPSAPGVR